MAEVMDKVCEDHAPYIITRAKAEPVVMLSLGDFEALEETAYLLKSPANAVRLAAAIEEVEALIAKQKIKKKKKK